MAEGTFEKFGQHREDVDLHEANLTRRGQSGDGSRESGVGSQKTKQSYGFAFDAIVREILVSAGCDLKEVEGLSAETEAFSAIFNSW